MKPKKFNEFYKELELTEFQNISEMCNMEFYGVEEQIGTHLLEIQGSVVKIVNNPFTEDIDRMEVETFLTVQNIYLSENDEQVYLNFEQLAKIRRFFERLNN